MYFFIPCRHGAQVVSGDQIVIQSLSIRHHAHSNPCRFEYFLCIHYQNQLWNKLTTNNIGWIGIRKLFTFICDKVAPADMAFPLLYCPDNTTDVIKWPIHCTTPSPFSEFLRDMYSEDVQKLKDNIEEMYAVFDTTPHLPSRLVKRGMIGWGNRVRDRLSDFFGTKKSTIHLNEINFRFILKKPSSYTPNSGFNFDLSSDE